MYNMDTARKMLENIKRMQELRLELVDELGMDDRLDHCQGAADDLRNSLERLESWAVSRLRDLETSALRNATAGLSAVATVPDAIVGIPAAATAPGPCLITYRDWHFNHHPLRRTWSCWGCPCLHVGELGDASCRHPYALSKYGCQQFNHTIRPWDMKVHVHPWFCPVLKERWESWPEQPAPDPLPDRGPEYDPRAGDKVLRALVACWQNTGGAQ